MKNAVFAALALLSGCAITHDAVPIGPNRYQISSMAAPARGGISGAQRLATERAGKYCSDRGKMLNVLGAETGHEFPVNGTAIVTFECD